MYLFSKDFLDSLVARLVGPMRFRFVLQPLMAVLLGVRDGKNDAKLGKPPFFLDLIFNPKDRKRNLKGAWKSLMVPIFIGTVLDLTERKQAELERHKFVLLADHSAEFIGICDMQFLPFYLN